MTPKEIHELRAAHIERTNRTPSVVRMTKDQFRRLKVHLENASFIAWTNSPTPANLLAFSKIQTYSAGDTIFGMRIEVV